MELVNTSKHKFKLYVYNRELTPIISIAWDNKLLGPAAVRVINELYAEGREELYEPWFEIRPSTEGPWQRSSWPVGMTSLQGKRFEPSPLYAGKLLLHPHPYIKFFNLTIHDVNRVVFSGDFDTEDLFRAGLEAISTALFEDPALAQRESPFYYEVMADSSGPSRIRHEVTMITPSLSMSGLKSENVFEIPRLEKDRERIKFKKISDEQIPDVDLSRFSQAEKKGQRGVDRRGRVILHRHVYNAMIEGLHLSSKAENGGYLLGHVYRLPESPADEEAENFRWIVEVTDVFKSEDTVGNAVLLMFTHDSWSAIKRKTDIEYKDKKLVSWFHTHLFKGSDSFGLSGLDQQLHANYFSKPWQVALLLNIDSSGKRELRCFQLDDSRKELVESTYEVLN